MTERTSKNLPPEVLTSIFKALEFERRTLFQLTLVSHTFNELATPFLYRSYQLSSDQDEEAFHSFYSYLWTILSYPKLALSIKHVSFHFAYGNRPRRARIGKYLRDLVESHIKFICTDWLKSYVEEHFYKQWLELARPPVLSSFYILLLYCLPNLETIFLAEGYKHRPFEMLLSATVALCRRASSSAEPVSSLPLAKLRSVRSWAAEPVSSWSAFDGLGSIFRLPFIHSVEIAMARDNAPNGIHAAREWEANKRSSQVERLSLQASEINAQFMGAVIGSCISLKEFHFTFSHNMSRGRLFYPQELLEELLAHAETLQVLRINYDDSSRKTDWDYDPALNTAKLSFGKELMKLKKLKHLAVNQSVMFGGTIGDLEWYDRPGQGPTVVPYRPSEFCLSDYLPPNLQQLQIFSCGSGVIPHFQRLADFRRQRSILEKLKKITLCMVNQAASQEVFRPVDMPGVEINYLIPNSPGIQTSMPLCLLNCCQY